jgi:hypothetical protein
MNQLFKFIRVTEDERGNLISKNIVVTSAVSLPEILQEFEHFLRGSGFYFEGNLELVEEPNLTEDENDN